MNPSPPIPKIHQNPPNPDSDNKKRCSSRPFADKGLEVPRVPSWPFVDKGFEVLRAPSRPFADKGLEVPRVPSWPFVDKGFEVLRAPSWPFADKGVEVLRVPSRIKVLKFLASLRGSIGLVSQNPKTSAEPKIYPPLPPAVTRFRKCPNTFRIPAAISAASSSSILGCIEKLNPRRISFSPFGHSTNL